MVRVVHEGGEREGRPGPQVGLDELCRLAAQEMLAVALEAERQAYLERHAAAVDEEGRRLVVGNGHARAREITTAAGRIAVQAPRIDDRRDGERYISALLPPYMRRSPKVSEVLLFAGTVANDEADIEALLARAESLGSPALVVDQPGSLARLVLGVAARRSVPVAYVPGLVMRRAADLYPGESKTDRRDAFVLADTGRTRRHQVHWLDAGNDELLEQLRVLNGYDTDLAADATRLSNRLRDALTSVSPALERVLGPKLHNAGVRDLLNLPVDSVRAL